MKTMMTNSRRVLKSSDVDDSEIVALATAALETPEPVVVAPAEPLLFTASETEALCETAREAGAQDAAAEVASLLERMNERLTELTAQEQQEEARGHAADAQAIADTALSICRWVLGRELQDPQQILGLVEAALTSTEVAGTQQLRLHPEAVEAVSSIAPEGLSVVADPELPRGEFSLRTDGPDIAFRFEAAMDRARTAILEDQ